MMKTPIIYEVCAVRRPSESHRRDHVEVTFNTVSSINYQNPGTLRFDFPDDDEIGKEMSIGKRILMTVDFTPKQVLDFEFLINARRSAYEQEQADSEVATAEQSPEAETPSEPTPEEFITDAIARKANVCLTVGPHEPKMSDVHAAFQRLCAAGYVLQSICPVLPVTEGICQYHFELPRVDSVAAPEPAKDWEPTLTHHVVIAPDDPDVESVKPVETLLNAGYHLEKTVPLGGAALLHFRKTGYKSVGMTPDRAGEGKADV